MRETSRSAVNDLRAEYNLNLMSVRECADLLHTSETTVKRLIYRRELQAIKIGGTWKVVVGSAISYCRRNCNDL